MGYHTASEIPNYWAYAKHFVLQDHMFAPESSWTLPSHLFLVSAWAATCPDLGDAMSCRSDLEFPGRNAADHDRKMWIPADGTPRPYVWADITWLLHKNHVELGVLRGSATCLHPACARSSDQEDTAPVQNPLPGFKTVAVDHQLAERPVERELLRRCGGRARCPRCRGSCRPRTGASTRRTTSATVRRG